MVQEIPKRRIGMKKVTLFRDGDVYGAVFYDGNKKTSWERLTMQEQQDLLGAMAGMFDFFKMFLKKKD